jgi:hypothetical protein
VQNGYSEIDVPAGAVDDEVTMSYVPLSPLHPTSPKLCAGWAFDLEIYDEVLQPDFHFITPVTVTVHYLDSDVAHVQENTLKLAYWDADTERWVDAGTTCPGPTAVQHNPQENWLAAQACRAGEYALLADGPLSIYLPLVLKRGHAPEPPKLILFDETHDENASLSWERAQQITPGHPEWRYFGRLQADLADEFTLVRHTAGPLTAELLARYDALWLASPRLPFSAAELAAIAQFQQNGGGLLLLTLDQAVDSSLLTGTGITADARLLFSLDGNGDFPVTLFADILAKDVDRMQTNWGGSLVVFEPAIPLAASGKAVFQDRNDNFTYDEGEPGGPFYIAAAFESGARRLIAASTQAFQDDFYDVRNNEPFARALLRWLTAARGSQPAPTPTPSGQWWKDGFDTASLGPQWWWINPDAAQWSLTARPGFLRILDHSGPAWGKNLLVQRAPGGPFYATTRVVFQPVSNYQSAGLVISNEAGAYLTLTRGYCDAPAPTCVGNGIYFDYTVDGQPVSSKYAVPSTGQGEAYLRLVGNAPTYSAYWSSDGRDWTFIGSHTMPGTGVPLIGLGVGGDLPGARIPADFDFFEVWSAIAP